MTVQLIIFDFDGVIADSETLANAVLAEVVTELGVPTTLDESLRLFMGKRLQDVITTVEGRIGRSLPHDFAGSFQARTLARFREALRPVEGVSAYIESFSDCPRAIASSSSPDRLAYCLGLLGLAETFSHHVYSASQVARGKPHPDIYLHVARCLNADPAAAIVIEDSVGGVRAGVAAGMTVIGLTAGSHCRDGYDRVLLAAGAYAAVSTYREAEAITVELLAARPSAATLARGSARWVRGK